MAFKDKKNRTPKNRKTKTSLVFDESARLDYLTGFRKRKNERRKTAQEEQQKKIKEEKKQLKLKRHELMKKSFLYTGKSKKTLPNLDDMEDKQEEVQELDNHTVTITDISHMDLAGYNGLMLGQNQKEDEEGTDLQPSHKPDVSDKHIKNNIKKIKKKENELQNKEKKKKQKKKLMHGKVTKAAKKYNFKKEKSKMMRLKSNFS